MRVPSGVPWLNRLSCAFAPDSSLLATWHQGKQTLIRLWDVPNGKLVRSFADKKDNLPGRMFFSPDGRTLLVAGWHVVGYEVASGKELFSWEIPPVPSLFDERLTPWLDLALSPQGSLLAAARNEFGSERERAGGQIVLFDTRTGKTLRRWQGSRDSFGWRVRLAFSPDGALLASSDSNAIHIWETATGKEIRTFRGHRGEVTFLAFDPDSRRLGSAGLDSTVLIWDATGRLMRDTAVADSWTVLAGDDAKRAHDAVWALARTPEISIPFLKARLRPVRAVNGEQLERWIKDLDSDQFALREKASLELHKLGGLAEPALRRALENKPTLEQRRRIEPMLVELAAQLPSGEVLRSLRAVRVLEYAGTAEARRLLRELANGAEGAALTRQAQAALVRLNRRARND